MKKQFFRFNLGGFNFSTYWEVVAMQQKRGCQQCGGVRKPKSAFTGPVIVKVIRKQEMKSRAVENPTFEGGNLSTLDGKETTKKNTLHKNPPPQQPPPQKPTPPPPPKLPSQTRQSNEEERWPNVGKRRSHHLRKSSS